MSRGRAGLKDGSCSYGRVTSGLIMEHEVKSIIMKSAGRTVRGLYILGCSSVAPMDIGFPLCCNVIKPTWVSSLIGFP